MISSSAGTRWSTWRAKQLAEVCDVRLLDLSDRDLTEDVGEEPLGVLHQAEIRREVHGSTLRLTG
jgi:hypothetical protein